VSFASIVRALAEGIVSAWLKFISRPIKSRRAASRTEEESQLSPELRRRIAEHEAQKRQKGTDESHSD